MTTEATTTDALARKRDQIVQRLASAIGAIDRRRKAVTDVATALAPRPADLPEPAGPGRSALVGAVAGGAVVAVALFLEHRRRERQKPLKVIQRAWFKYAVPPRPSLASRLLKEAVGALLMSTASEVAHGLVQRALEARREDDGPEVLDRVSDVPEPTFVSEPVTTQPLRATPEAALAPSAISPPDPIAPLPSPLREFT